MNVKQFRILNIMDTTMDPSNFEVFVCELAEIKNIMESFDKTGIYYDFSGEGELYVIPKNSFLGTETLDKFHAESVLDLNIYNFYSRIEFKNGRDQRIWYHNAVEH